MPSLAAECGADSPENMRDRDGSAGPPRASAPTLRTRRIDGRHAVYSVVTWYTGVQGHSIQFCGRLKHPKHRGEQDALGAQNCERTKT